MKEGWEIKKLGSLCSVNRDSGIHSDMPYLGMENIGSGNGMVISDGDISCVVGTTNLFRKGDVLYGKLRPYLKKVVVAEYDGCCSTEIVPLKCNDRLYPDYLKYWFLEDSTSDRINATCGGCRMPRANMKDVLQFDIPITTLTEQQRIVDVLDAEFEKIDRLRSNAELNLQHAKALFQAALKTELEPKEGWEEKTLKQIGTTQTGTTPKTSVKSNYGNYIPFIKPSDVNVDGLGGLDYSNEGLSEQGARNGRVFAPNSILMVCIGATIGKIGYSTKAVSSNQQINILSPYKDNFKYLYYCMSSPSFQQAIVREGESAKATLPIINKSKWENLRIHIPSLSIQERIVATLDKLNAKCRVLQDNYAKTIALCDDLKQALLRKAFNGEL